MLLCAMWCFGCRGKFEKLNRENRLCIFPSGLGVVLIELTFNQTDVFLDLLSIKQSISPSLSLSLEQIRPTKNCGTSYDRPGNLVNGWSKLKNLPNKNFEFSKFTNKSINPRIFLLFDIDIDIEALIKSIWILWIVTKLITFVCDLLNLKVVLLFQSFWFSSCNLRRENKKLKSNMSTNRLGAYD